MNGFVNPYNFIKFPQNKAKAYTDTDKHTGVIEYSVTTKTPLFIPNSSSDHAFRESDQKAEHKSYDFFSYEELDPAKHYEGMYHEPVIPGSEIRGVVRNVYETLTDSCMGVLNGEKYPVKRTAEQFRPALIHRKKDGTMELCAAESYRIGSRENKEYFPKGFEKKANGTTAYFKMPDRTQRGFAVIDSYSFDNSQNGEKKGYLLKWGMGVKKAHYHIFAYKPGNPFGDEKDKNRNNLNQRVQETISLTKDIIKRKIDPVIESYLSQPALDQKNQKAYVEYRDDLNKFLNKQEEGYFPVNCSRPVNTSKQVFYLSPAVFTKEVSNEKLSSYVGKFTPCAKEYCPACDLFGYIGADNTTAMSSKIRFSDLYVKDKLDAQKYYAADKVTLEALGEPKLGNVDFYVNKPDKADFWTYDYYIVNGNTKLGSANLRGRKYYWHHRKVDLNKKIEPDKLNKTIRPVKEGITFSGKLFFEAISERQLQQLLWILNSGSEQLGLKLGGAKPLGYGSVACKVDKVQERCVTCQDDELLYKVKENTYDVVRYEEVGFSKDAKKEFYKIAGLETVPIDVEISYPKTANLKNKPIENGYEWFVNNHDVGRMVNRRNAMRIKQQLPSILDEDFSLPYYQKQENTNKKGNYNKYNGNHDPYKKNSGKFKGNK